MWEFWGPVAMAGMVEIPLLGLGFRVLCSWFRVQGLGSRVFLGYFGVSRSSKLPEWREATP